MRIIHICQRDHPDIGGSLRVAEALVMAQRNAGLDAWLLFLYGPPAHISAALAPHVVCLGLHSSREAAKGLVRLKQAILKIDPDVIHSHDGILWPRLVYGQLRIPLVMHAHLPAEAARKYLASTLIKKTTDALIGISKPTIDTWIAAGFDPGKIHYVPNGVDVDRFRRIKPEDRSQVRMKLGIPADKKVVLWLGRMHRGMKGSERAERFARMLPEDTVMVLVGNGPEFEGVRTRNADLLKTGRFMMTGATMTPEDYYQIADVFLFTSHYEPFGLVILEAVSSEVPIVAFPVDKGGGATALLQEFGAYMISDELTPEAVATSLRAAMSHPAAVAEQRCKLQDSYAWSTKSKEVVELYRTLCGDPSKPQVLACQHGARHRYAIPRMLNKAGMLAAFYTDSSAKSILGRMSVALGRHAPAHLKRLAGRKIEGVPSQKIYSSDCTYIVDLLQMLNPVPNPGIMLNYKKHKIIANRMKVWGLKGANVTYSMYHEDLDFLRWAKSKGIRCVVDVFICPVTDDILTDEYLAFPDWVEGNSETSNDVKRKLWQETADLADLLVCPSEWVADGVRLATPFAADKIRIVPYGCSIDYQGQVNKPVPGRILFAGGDALRKGLHYLAQAASILRQELPELDVRIAGNLPSSVVDHPDAKDLHFLGKLGWEQMKAEYLSADALVLPALSEGFAGVVAEAIGAGCPVIVTKEAGSPIVHEREGLIITSRDVASLVAAMRRMVADRALRQRCSENCLAEIPFYSEKAWENRLVNVMSELC